MMLPTWWKTVSGLTRILAEIGDDLLDVQPCVADAIPAESDELGSAFDLGCQRVDVDIGPLELGENGLSSASAAAYPVATGSVMWWSPRRGFVRCPSQMSW
jgi:hypothetical protein